MPYIQRHLAAAVLALCLPGAPLFAQRPDLGLELEALLRARSGSLFGIDAPLPAPADEGDYVPREEASASERVLLASGLRAQFVSRRMARLADMLVFWPDPLHYTHLILCIEQTRSGTTPGGQGGLNPSIQRVEVATGAVETLLHGMSRCDGIRATSWGTLLATEESGDGRAYEILDPLGTTDHWVANRSTGDVRDRLDGLAASTKVVQRRALPTIAWEGLAVLPEGVVYAGDELGPGIRGPDADGGALFKFIPAEPRTSLSPIQDLAQSPLVAGSVYALTVSCQEPSGASFPQHGQGCEVGVGAWLRVRAEQARAEAAEGGATGYDRPEDLHRDPVFAGSGARICWTSTGRALAARFGEVLCAVDPTPVPAQPSEIVDPASGVSYLAEAEGGEARHALVFVERFLEGNVRFNSLDNLHFQPGTGLLYVAEDARYGEVWACLPDGADLDARSDGCLPALSVVDPLAEPTGFQFDGTGEVAYLVLQHGEQPPELEDRTSNPVDGRTDDLLRITGFRDIPLPWRP